MADDANSRKIGRMLRNRYILALTLVAFLVVLSQGIIQLAILSQQDDSRVVNIAGRQRMLSQRINKTVFGLYLNGSAENQERYLKELQLSLDLWQRSHQGLQNGDGELGLPGKNSPRIIEMFRGIEPQYEAIVGAASSVSRLAAAPGYAPEALFYDMQVIQRNEPAFLKGMDAIVFQYDSESKDKIRMIKLTELAILIVTLLMLTLEALFIFRPAQREIEGAVAEIETGRTNLEKLFETAPTAMLLIDGESFSVMKQNRLAQEMLNLPPEHGEHIDLPAMLELNPNEMRELVCRMTAGIPSGNTELVLNVPGSMSRVVQLSANLIRYEGIDTILVGLADITRLKEAEEVLKRYATVDEMTGLLNKRSGMLVLANAYERVQSGDGELSVCFMDIDGLKAVNDTYGHEEGDFYIRTIARVIRSNVSFRDTVFRYGGDEIVLILGDCDMKTAQAVLHRIEGSLARAARLLKKPYAMHISHGAAVYRKRETETPEALLTLADQAMYENKRRYKETQA